MAITNKEYRLIKDYVYDQFGINLGDRRKALVTGRLNKVLKENGFKSFKAYFKYVINDTSGEALNTLINRISTNHTFFYREKVHLEYMTRNVLPELSDSLKRKNSREIRVWSCGCSSGEEAYTLAMLLLEFFRIDRSNWKIGVLGTDISDVALESARTGIYKKENASRLPVNLKHKYFDILDRETWRVREEVQKRVLFRRMNLMTPVFPFKQKFHAIFCRNVMIYFDKSIRDALISKLHNVMESKGYLFVGLSESLSRSTHHGFKYIQPGVYRKI
jgi:chemotaxis protein methyltransferase CheR